VSIYFHTLTSIIMLILIILFVVYMRYKGIFKEENSSLFAWLVMQVTLPALIFSALAHSTVEWKYFLLFLMMFAMEIFIMVLAWGIGRLMKLKNAQMGSFLLASAFGSSALLGYPLIVELFPNNNAVLTEAAFVSELGVGLPLFTMGVMIAMYYGNVEDGTKRSFSGMIQFFYSPVFVAIAVGTLWSLFSLPTRGEFFKPFFDTVHILSSANTFLVTLMIGVLLKFESLFDGIKIMIAVVLLKLVLTPLLISFPASFMSLEMWQMEVLILEASMPSAMLSVVLANRYGCDARLAAKLVFVTLFASVATLSVMIRILG